MEDAPEVEVGEPVGKERAEGMGVTVTPTRGATLVREVRGRIPAVREVVVPATRAQTVVTSRGNEECHQLLCPPPMHLRLLIAHYPHIPSLQHLLPRPSSHPPISNKPQPSPTSHLLPSSVTHPPN